MSDGRKAAPLYWQTMPLIDEWLRARTVPGGRARIGELHEDWARFVAAAGGQGNAGWWRTRSMRNALAARGFGMHKSGDRYATGISLRPAGELAPTAPAAADGPDTI